ncbi:MAG: hypothetical protein K5888_12700 [Lachnospiraceae bacterium]|nr:hypothetical protein [Lachnospiraceae bacterium]
MNNINEEKLEYATGVATNNKGNNNGNNKSAETKRIMCPKCGEERDFLLGSGGRAYCTTCREQIFI